MDQISICLCLFMSFIVVMSQLIPPPYVPCEKSDACLQEIPCNTTDYSENEAKEFYQVENCRFTYFMNKLKELDCIFDTINENDDAKIAFREEFYKIKEPQEPNCKDKGNSNTLAECTGCWKTHYETRINTIQKKINSLQIGPNILKRCQELDYLVIPDFITNCQRVAPKI